MALLKPFDWKRRLGACLPALLLGAVLVAAPAGLARAQTDFEEHEVKAAYLFNFTKFVMWPPEAFADGSPIRLCVFGQDPFGKTLDRLVQGESLEGRELTVVRPDRIQELKSCHVLFISRSERGRLNEILADLRGTSVLTVGETDGFLQRGGLINFIRQGGKVRFEINEKAAERAPLKISSKLLRLASLREGGG